MIEVSRTAHPCGAWCGLAPILAWDCGEMSMRSSHYPMTLLVLGLLVTVAVGAGEAPRPKRPTVSSLPAVPVEIQEALQAREFESAIRRIDAALKEKEPQAPDYLLYLKGLAQFYAEQWDAAHETYTAFEKQHPASPWLSRARFGRAAVFARQRNYQAAAAIYKAEAERLLSSGRTDELTAIYLEFADRYFEGIPVTGPTTQKQPDYAQALSFYQQSLQLRPSRPVRQKVELRIARCHQELAQLPQAIAAWQNYLQTGTGKRVAPADRLPPALETEARFQLGRAQLAAGQPAEARKSWEDLLASDAAKEAGGPLLAEAAYRLAQTYGIPAPATVGDLELGVAALEKFIKAHPKHELVPQAEFEIAQSYAHHGRFEQVVTALRKLIENPDFAKAKQVPAAWHLLGQSYASQKKYEAAIDAWRQFLDKYPADPNWSQVQRVIIDTEYAQAEEQRTLENYAKARTLWETFLNKYPLDGRAAAILLNFGQMHYDAGVKLASTASLAEDEIERLGAKPSPEAARQRFEAALDDWRRVVSKYPGTAEASQAAFNIGATLEDRLLKLEAALEAFRKVEGPQQGAAQQRIANLTARQLELITERKFRTNEKPRVKLATRNLENVTVKLYQVDLADYFRKMHLATGIESLDIALIDPDKSWEYKIDKFEKFRRTEQEVELPIEGPGVTAVTVSSDSLEATTMVIVSDIDILVKTSRNELFVFAENLREGKPVEGVKLLISDGSQVFAEAVTGKDGILQKKFEELKTARDLRVFAVQEGHSASSVISLEGLQFAVGLSPKGYLYSDRPAYRAGQLVNLRGLIRWVADDRYTFKAGEKYQLDVYDARGRVLHTESVALGEFGTLATHFTLPASAPQGQYRVHLHQPGREQSYESGFLVHEYQLEPIQFSIDLPQKVVYRGEHVKGKLSLKYYYGTPLAGRTIQYRLGDDRLYTAETDAQGEVAFDLETQRYSESQPLVLSALYAERNLAAQETVFVATRGFEIGVSTLRHVYITGETFDASISVNDAAGKPVATPLKLELFEQTPAVRGLPAGERLVKADELKSDEKAGQARQTLRVEKAGRYIVRASGVDRFGNTVSGSTVLIISGADDQVRLRILADKHHYKVGETGKVELHWREKPALALVTFEGAEVLGYRLIELKTGSNTFEFPLAEQLAPNFDLSVAVMQTDRFHEGRSEFRVSRELLISLRTDQQTLKPGDPLSVDVLVTDPTGKPVSAEVSLALIQKNLLQFFPDRSGALDAFFNGGSRQVSVRATTSCVFRYAPPTRPINLFLLAEEDRRKVFELEAEARSSSAALVDRELQLKTRLAEEYKKELATNFGDFDGNGPTDSVEVMEELAAPVAGAAFGMAAGGLGGGGTAPGMNKPRGGADRKRMSSHAGRSDALARQKRRSGAEAGDKPAHDWAARGLADEAAPEEAFYAGTKFHMDGKWFDISGNGNFGNTADLRAYFNTPQGLTDLSRSTNGTLLALNRFGEFQVVNGLAFNRLEELARQGLEILPNMPLAETGYWNPRIATDKEGKATILLRLPDRSTAWKLLSKGINHDSLAGQAEAEIITKKELFGELKLPPAFTVGDQAEVLVEVHNGSNAEGAIEVKLKVTIGDKTIELKKSVAVKKAGIEELSFPVEITAGDSANFELTVSRGELTDLSSRSAMLIPHGLPVFATVSGTAAQNTSAIVAAPTGMTLENQQLELIIGPSVNRALLDAVLGGAVTLYERKSLRPINEIDRAVSDVLGGVAVMKLLGASRTTDSPEAQGLSGRIQAAISLLVSGQRDDGGWSWSGRLATEKADRYGSSRAMWALANARRAGFAVPQPIFDKGIQYLNTTLTATAEGDLEARCILLHGLAEAGAADFAHANRLHRSRNNLSAAGLAHLALVFVRLDRQDFAKELLAIAKGKIPLKAPAAGAAADDPALVGCIPWMQSGVEVRALLLLAANATQPGGTLNSEVADWLMKARTGVRWVPEKANGPAIAALADWFGRSKLTNEKYTLSIYANERLVEKLTIDPSSEPSRTIAVPAKLLAADKPQRINIDIEGRGTFSYSAVLAGFVPADKLKNTTNDWGFHRLYEPAPRLLDGEAIPRGFGVVAGPVQGFTNPLTQLPLGERGEVSINIWRHNLTGSPQEHLEYLVYTEPIPAGTSVLVDSIRGSFERYEITPGAITFYLGDRPHPGGIQFSLVGYLPGKFKNVPSLLRSFYRPERMMVAKDLPLEVLARGAKTRDEYRLSPQELYEFGKRYAARRDFAEASKYLTPLFKDYRLHDNIHREVVQMLFESALASKSHGETVQYFEIIKEKYPDVEVSFENILQVAQAYLELAEYERGYLVYRATAEAGFQRESQIAGFLDERGEFLRSVQVMERLLREYPAEAYIATAMYALAQEIYGKAPEAAGNAKLREAGVTRIDLIATAIQVLDQFLATWPTDPAADQASFSLANAMLDLEQYQAAIDRSARFAERFADSKLVDSFWYVIGYSQFALGRHDAALEMCRKVAEYKRKDRDTGVEVAAANQWQAIYIMGQVFHSLGKPAEAISEYQKVKDRFSDASEAIAFFTRKAVSLPEVTTIKPGELAKVPLSFRNVTGAAIKVYRIDLLKFSLLQRNLSRITGINLAGIRPYHDLTLELGDGKDYRDREKALELPLKEEGAYLVVCQAENLYASGLVLVSPLALEVQEDLVSGRVRVTVKDTVADRYAHNIHVKVIGSDNPQFVSGQTDLRGIFVADGIRGTSTVIARTDANRYAFFRGKLPLGNVPKSSTPADAAPAEGAQVPPQDSKDTLLKGLRDQNFHFNGEQRTNYRNLLRNKQQGVPAKAAY